MVHVTYAWYIRESAIACQIHSHLSNKHRLYTSPVSQQTFHPTKVQNPRNPTRKPILLPQKDSKSRWKRSRIEGKHLTNGEEGQRRHSRNWKALISLIKPE